MPDFKNADLEELIDLVKTHPEDAAKCIEDLTIVHFKHVKTMETVHWFISKIDEIVKL